MNPMLRARTCLLLLAIPLAVLWWWLCWQVPKSDWNGLNSLADGKRFSLTRQTDPWRESIVFDLERQQYDSFQEATYGVPFAPTEVRFSISNIRVDKLQHRLQLNLFDPGDLRLIRSIEMSLPLDVYPRIVAGQFIVADTSEEIRWLDLKDSSETWQTMPMERGSASWQWSHPSLPVFRRSTIKSAQLSGTQAQQHFTELFRFNEQRKLELICSWPTGNVGMQAGRSAWFQGNTATSLDLSGAFIEVRSLDDGQLLKKLTLAPPVDLSKQRVSFSDGLMLLKGGSGIRYYSITHEKWLAAPFDSEQDWTRATLQISNDSKVALWGLPSKQTAVITDPVTDRQICRITEPGESYEFLDSKTLVSIDSWFGLTVRQHDIQTGATLLTWRPFWWALPLFVIAILGSVVWVCRWLCLARPSVIWAWGDLHLLHLLLIVLIVLRIRAVGDTADIGRLPYLHAIYLTSGFLFMAWAGVVAGGGSIVSRLSRCLVVYAIVLGGLAQTLGTNQQTLATTQQLAWMGVALVTVPSLLALPIFLMARVRSWSLVTALSDSARQGAKTRKDSVTLRQILVVTAVVACVALAVRPLASGIAGVTQLQWPVWQAAGITFSGLTAMLLATSKNTRLQRIGSGLAASIVLVLIVESFCLATYGGWWRPKWWILYAMQTRHVLGFFCTVFVLASVLVAVGSNDSAKRDFSDSLQG